jgi:hypothetical protein
VEKLHDGLVQVRVWYDLHVGESVLDNQLASAEGRGFKRTGFAALSQALFLGQVLEVRNVRMKQVLPEVIVDPLDYHSFFHVDVQFGGHKADGEAEEEDPDLAWLLAVAAALNKLLVIDSSPSELQTVQQ